MIEAQFRKHLLEDDPLVQAVLRGHLLVEQAVDEYLEGLCLHPEYLRAARLSFAEKVLIVRSLSTQSEFFLWDFVNGLNGLRNEMAHSLEGVKLHSKLGLVRSLVWDALKRLGDKKAIDWIKAENSADELLVAVGAMMCASIFGGWTDGEIKKLPRRRRTTVKREGK